MRDADDDAPPWHGRAWSGALTDDASSAGSGRLAIGAAVQRIAELGGWDARMPPEATWTRVHGSAPFPDPDAWALAPTYGPLDPYVQDETVTDIHLSRPGERPTLRRNGDAVDLEVAERWHAAWWPWIAAQITRRGVGRRQHGVCEGSVRLSLPGRRPAVVRYLIVEPPICPHGPALTLRVLHPKRVSMRWLVEGRTLSEEMATLLSAAVRADVDLYLVGAPGAGKTTLCQALVQLIADYRVVCLEDVAEIDLDGSHGVRLLAPHDDSASFIALVRMALRMNPRRVVIGEVRGGEAYAALLAASNGYPILTTVHGDHAAHGVRTLAVKAAQAAEVQGRMDAIYALINARPALVVALGRVAGRRVVRHIGEVTPQGGSGRPIVEIIYEYDSGSGTWRQTAPLTAALEQRLVDSGVGWEGAGL
jgi:pilus assembly protein CpaF